MVSKSDFEIYDVKPVHACRDIKYCMQVIGKVGFGKSFNALASLDAPAEQDIFKDMAAGANSHFQRVCD